MLHHLPHTICHQKTLGKIRGAKENLYEAILMFKVRFFLVHFLYKKTSWCEFSLFFFLWNALTSMTSVSQLLKLCKNKWTNPQKKDRKQAQFTLAVKPGSFGLLNWWQSLVEAVAHFYFNLIYSSFCKFRGPNHFFGHGPNFSGGICATFLFSISFMKYTLFEDILHL